MRMLYHSKKSEDLAKSAWKTILAWRAAQVLFAAYTQQPPSRPSRPNQTDLVLWAHKRFEKEALRAQNEILEIYMPHVEALCRRYHGARVDMDELVQTGRIALTRAIQKFDPAKGMSFWQYAGKWAFADIKRVLEQSQSAITIPASARSQAKAAEAKQREMQRRHGCAVSLEDAYAALGLDASKHEIAVAREVSLDAELEGGDVLHSLLPSVECDEEVDVLAKRRIVTAVARLPERERSAVSAFFGFNGPAQTYEAIGAVLGVTRERVRQIVNNALVRLRPILSPAFA